MKRRSLAFMAALAAVLLALAGTCLDCGVGSLPVGQPLEVYRFSGGEMWQSWVNDGCVLWMQSAGPTGHNGLGYSGSADWDVRLRFVDLRDLKDSTTITKNDVHDVPGLSLPAPRLSNSSAEMLTLPLAWAAVLPNGSGKPFKLVWAVPPEQLSENYFYHGLSSWTLGAKNAESLLPRSAESISGLASGDALAIPVPVASFNRQSDPVDSRNWEKLLMLTANMSEPMAVDPAAPRLPDAALTSLSPYFALLDSGVATGPTVRIFDLRTGQKLPMEVPPLPETLPIIAGHRAAWYTANGDVYLADLDTKAVQKVLSLDTSGAETSLALDQEWLVALRVTGSPGLTSSSTAPSQHPGADLVALHLPDLQQVDFPGVVAQGEVGGVQVSQGLVLLGVSPAIEPMPHNEPAWVSLRVIKLPS